MKLPVRNMKREAMTWKKIFVNHNIAQKPYIQNIDENSKLKSKTNNSVRKWAERHEQTSQ